MGNETRLSSSQQTHLPETGPKEFPGGDGIPPFSGKQDVWDTGTGARQDAPPPESPGSLALPYSWESFSV